jgi:hypothetical protein
MSTTQKKIFKFDISNNKAEKTLKTFGAHEESSNFLF